MSEIRTRKVPIDQCGLLDPTAQHALSKIIDFLRADSSIGTNASAPLTVAELGTFLHNVMSTMENLCGKDSPRPRPVTKFPANSFRDFSENGFVHVLTKLLVLEAAKKRIPLVQVFAGDAKSQSKLLVMLEQQLTKVYAVFFERTLIQVTTVIFCIFLERKTG